MHNIPVSSSVFSAKHLGEILKQDYPFGQNVSCRLLKSWVNDTYLIEDHLSKYIFRVYHYNWRTEKEILAELQLIQLLKQNSIPVSFPIADKTGNFVQKFAAPEGTRYGVLFSFAKGKKQLRLPEQVHFAIGETMAKMHQLTLDLRINRIHYTPEILLLDSYKKFESFLQKGSASADFLVQTQQYLYEKLKNISPKNVRTGAIHFDLWADNMSIDANHKFTIFDFDFCGNGWLCTDIAYYGLMLYTVEPDEIIYQNKLGQFYQGYCSVTPIRETEKSMLPFLATSLYFFYLGVQCERFSAVYFNEDYLQQFIESRVRKWVGFCEL